MAKEIQTRIKQKHDTEANWNSVKDSFIPEAGELIIYDADASHPYSRIKVGDGATTVGALPFVIDKAALNITARSDQTITGVKTFTSRPTYQAIRLPSEYQEVEYIANDGNINFITDVKPTDKTHIKAKLYNTSDQNKNWFGADNIHSEVDDAYVVNAYSTYELEYVYAGNDGWTILTSPVSIVNSVFTLDFNLNHRIYINGMDLGARLPSTEFASDEYLEIFSKNGGNATSRVVGRIYSFKIFEDRILIRDYVPAYRKSDKTIGLYDLVNNAFLTESKGSGKFNVGSDLISGNLLIENDLAPVAISGNYSDLTNIPTSFTPSTHGHSLDEVSDAANYVRMTQAERTKLAAVEISYDSSSNTVTFS